MNRILVLILALLPILALSKAKIDEDNMLAQILALYPDDLVRDEYDIDREWGRMTMDAEEPYYPESVGVLPMDADTTCFVAMVTWGPEGSRGLLVDFYEFERMDTHLRLISNHGGGQIGYGGGTQRYGEPVLVDSVWDLGAGIPGFTLEMSSGHFASQTNSEEMYLFAVMDGEIHEVLHLETLSGMEALELWQADPNDQEFIADVFANIEEYDPKGYRRECICETHRQVLIGKGSSLGLKNLIVEETKYQVTKERIVKTVRREAWRWDGYAYTTENPEN